MEYSTGCEKEANAIKQEDFCYNEELDSIFKDINDFSHHDPTITYNDPLLDISNNQVGNKISKITNYCEPFQPFLEPHTQGTLKTEPFIATKDNFNFELKNMGNKMDNGNIFKINYKNINSTEQIDFFGNKMDNDDSFKLPSKVSREDISKNGVNKVKASENFCVDSFKINTKVVGENIKENGQNQIKPIENGVNKMKSSENICGECGEDCEDWLKLLAHVCKSKPQEKAKPLKKKTSHRNVIVITDDVDENGKAIEYKVRLQDVNNNAEGKMANNNVIQTVTNKSDEPKKRLDTYCVDTQVWCKTPEQKAKKQDIGPKSLHKRYPLQMVGNEYPCNECDRVFKRVCNLTQHQKATHAIATHYSCNQCGQLFKSTSMLLKHVNLTHKKSEPSKLASTAQFLTPTGLPNGLMKTANSSRPAQFLNENASLGLSNGLMKTGNSSRPDVNKNNNQPRYWQPPKQQMSMGSYASNLTTHQEFQNKAAPLIKSKPIPGYPWQMGPSSSKETKELQSNGALFQNNSNDFPGKSLQAGNVCSGVGPHLHMQGHNLNGIPILQSCKSQFVIDPPPPPPAPVTSAPVWLTHRAAVEPSDGRCSGYDASHRPRSRKGPWSVNGSLPYLRISLSSGAG